ncbi:BamA/TamA family outer membrane protein [Paludibaculum fermentans]|uniref:BamA/TamA family outer membrane protein n=1 Tax=Paludibaculum fermentans TaxID=1473598 RepID=UPI003EC0F71F
MIRNVTLFTLLGARIVFAQAPAPAPAETREEEIAREQAQKAESLKKPQLEKGEALFDKYFNSALRGLFAPKVGLGLRLGGLATGSGFAAGVLYNRPDLLHENLIFRASLAGSAKRYWAGATELSLPHLAGDRVRANFYARHSDAPRNPYYGPGPNSQKSYKSYYREEDTSFDGRVSWRPDRRNWDVGMYAGYLRVNVGPGTNGEYPSSETLFTPAMAPGIQQQTNFVRYGPFAQVDFRDNAGNPHRGGNYVVRLLNYDDQNGRGYSFRRFDGWTEQYIPFFNEKRVIALRALTELSWTDRGNVVPFYLQPTLGDANDLRGYQLLRYRDNNSVLLSSEYRWEVAPGLDMAVFMDAGRVFSHPSQLSLNNLRYTGGLGFRAKTRDAVVLRLDAGFSREGWMLWFKFDNAFSREIFRYLF